MSAYIDAMGWRQDPGALGDAPFAVAYALSVELGDRVLRALREEER